MRPSETRTPGGNLANADQSELSSPIVVDGIGERKELVTLTAKFALLGYSLNELSGGEFMVHRWNLTRSLPDLRAARQFYRQIGGAP